MKRLTAILSVLVFVGFMFVSVGKGIGPNEGRQNEHKQTQKQNVILHVVARQALFFSAHTGTWTSVHLELGERVLHKKATGNVALVVTSKRAVGFSGVISNVAEVSLDIGHDKEVEAVEIDGNVASVLTNRKAYGFSALLGNWSEATRSHSH